LKIIIIGGNAAGMSAASKARRNDSQAEITVFEKSGAISYGSCGLPYFISDDIKDVQKLVAISRKDFMEKRKIAVHLFQQALSFDARKRVVVLKDLNTGTLREETYDRLIIATGARAVLPKLSGIELENVFTLRTLQDGLRIKSFVDQTQPRTVVIVGAGYIGLELAEALSKRGLQVHLVEMLDQVMPNMDEDMAGVIREELEKQKVKLYLSNALRALEGQGRVEQVLLGDGRKISAEMVIISIGVKPNTDFALTGGIQLGRSGAIAVNERMQTNIRHVFAAGDCAEAKSRITNKATYLPLGTTANKQGRIAGDNATGRQTRFKGITSTSAVKVFNLEVASTGISSAFAERLKLAVQSVRIISKSRAGYFPGVEKIVVKLIFAPQGGRLLGAQLVGGEGVAKRIDVLSVAVQQKMTVEEVAASDLSYAPPFAPVWDPILVAANQAVKMVRKN